MTQICDRLICVGRCPVVFGKKFNLVQMQGSRFFVSTFNEWARQRLKALNNPAQRQRLGKWNENEKNALKGQNKKRMINYGAIVIKIICSYRFSYKIQCLFWWKIYLDIIIYAAQGVALGWVMLPFQGVHRIIANYQGVAVGLVMLHFRCVANGECLFSSEHDWATPYAKIIMATPYRINMGIIPCKKNSKITKNFLFFALFHRILYKGIIKERRNHAEPDMVTLSLV